MLPDKLKLGDPTMPPMSEDYVNGWNECRQECQALLADALRYRWLRDRHLHSLWHPIGEVIGMDEVIPGDDPDTAIDAAMRGERMKMATLIRELKEGR